MNFHQVCTLFPSMSDVQLAELAEDIKQNGLREPIWQHTDGSIIDGRNRYLACKKAGIEPQFRTWNGSGGLVALVWSLNGVRRHLDSGQKAAIAVEMLPMLEEEARKRQAHGQTAPGRTLSEIIHQALPIVQASKAAAEAAKITGTNAHYVADAKKLKAESPLLFEKVKAGETTIIAAKREVKEQKREDRRDANRQKIQDVPAASVVTAGVKFSTIVIDPPWDWGDEGDVNQLGRAKPDYATMSIQQLLDLPVEELSDIDSHCYLWITNRSLPKGFALLERWGFRYVTALTWVKPHFGMGNYFRGQTEHVLFGVRGSQMLKRKDVGTVFHAERGKEHSAKPPEFTALVESCSPGPYLEMFSRSNRQGRTSWGEVSAAAA